MDVRLRQTAKREGRSINQVAIEALERGLGLGEEPVEQRDLDWAMGTWVEDAAMDEAIAWHERIDDEAWKLASLSIRTPTSI